MCVSGYKPKRNENVHRSLFIVAKKKKKKETAQISNNRKMDQQIVVCLYNGILLSNQKEQNINTYNNIDKSQEHYTEQNKLDTRSIYCMIPLIWKQEQAKLIYNVRKQVMMEIFSVLIVGGGYSSVYTCQNPSNLHSILVYFITQITVQ